MSKDFIDDQILSENIKTAEIKILDNLPEEKELSYVFSKRFEKKMNKLIKREKRTPFMRMFIRYGERVAIIFLVIVSISFVTTMSVEAYRVRFFEKITEVWEEFTSIIFKSEEGIHDGKLTPVTPEYLPKDFSVIEEDLSDYVNTIIYVSIDNEEMFYEQRLISHGEILLDTEDIEVKTMEIGDTLINWFNNKEVNQIYWSDDLYIYTLISPIDMEEIIKITKSILENNKKVLN